MGFSEQVKNELARIEVKKRCCGWAELSALLKANGSLEIIKQQLALKVVSQQAAAARKIYRLLKERFDFLTEIVVSKAMYLNYDKYYIIKLPPQDRIKELLINCGLIKENYELSYQVNGDLVKNKCCRKAYLRGVFLGAGSINNPEAGYHLELRVSNQGYAQSLLEFAKQKLDLYFKLRQRQEDYLLYLKSSADIVKLLNITGAHSALLDYENTRVLKEVKNQVNRLVNCETANLTKTVQAAREQIENIKLIEEFEGLASLSPSLQEMAELRLANPYATYKELGELMEPQLSKSGVNHRLRRLNKIAKEIKENNSLLRG